MFNIYQWNNKKCEIKFHGNHYRRHFSIKLSVSIRRLQNNGFHNTHITSEYIQNPTTSPHDIATTLRGARSHTCLPTMASHLLLPSSQESTSTQPPVDAFKKAIRPLLNTLQWLSMLLRIKLSPYNGLCGWTQSVPPVCATLHPINSAHLHSCRFLLLCTHFDPARLTSWLFPEYLSMLLAWCL